MGEISTVLISFLDLHNTTTQVKQLERVLDMVVNQVLIQIEEYYANY